MTELESKVYEIVSVFTLTKREIVQRFHRQDIRATLQAMIASGLIFEQGSGRAGDPKLLVAGRKPAEAPVMFPFVTSVPRSVWADFLARCVLANKEPECVLAELLARPVPSISQNVDRGY